MWSFVSSIASAAVSDTDCKKSLETFAMAQKVMIYRKGGYDRLEVQQQPIRPPSENEVLVRSKAAGVNFADTLVRLGLYRSADEHYMNQWPRTPGFEFAGEIIAIGDAVHNRKVGDRVFGITRFEGYSSHVLIPETQVFEMPTTFTFEQAAAFPAAYMTAFHALQQTFALRHGMTFLVHSAAGGVGSALLRLSKILGCKTVAVVGSDEKVATAKEAGADYVVVRPKKRGELWRMWRQIEVITDKISPEGFDAVFDANGISTLEQSYRHLRATGKLIAYGFASNIHLTKDGQKNLPPMILDWVKSFGLTLQNFNPLNMTPENKSLITFNLSFLLDRKDLLEEGMNWLLSKIQVGEIPPPQVTTYPLKDVTQAQRDMASGRTVGKLVLIPE